MQNKVYCIVYIFISEFFIDKIYVCGGFDGTTRHLTMEYYDQTADKWNLLESTSVGREGAGLVSLGDSLYCIGGYDGINLLKSVERYDLVTSTWSTIGGMLTPRSGAGCAALNYRIFVCGGIYFFVNSVNKDF